MKANDWIMTNTKTILHCRPSQANHRPKTDNSTGGLFLVTTRRQRQNYFRRRQINTFNFALNLWDLSNHAAGEAEKIVTFSSKGFSDRHIKWAKFWEKLLKASKDGLDLATLISTWCFSQQQASLFRMATGKRHTNKGTPSFFAIQTLCFTNTWLISHMPSTSDGFFKKEWMC